MKPIRLILSAFGSYAGCECVDFEKMQQGLFLITGDTGSGKTTIFDGISYALYGQTSGRRRDGEMMRSQYANDTDETFVEFTFKEKAAVYTVRRNPSWERRSKRKNKDGEYTRTKVSAKVELILNDGTVFPGKMKETDQKIVEIIGMDMNQFSQVSMISQGDFMKLLLASSKERKEIFSKIFSTQIYLRIQNQLKNLERERYEKLERIRMQCQNEIQNAQCIPESLYTEQWKEKGVFSEVDHKEMFELLKKMSVEAVEKEEMLAGRVKEIDNLLEVWRVWNEKEGKHHELLEDIERFEQEVERQTGRVQEKEEELKKFFKSYEQTVRENQKKIFQIQQEIPEYQHLDREKKKLSQTSKDLSEGKKKMTAYENEADQLAKKDAYIKEQQECLKDCAVQKVRVEQEYMQWKEKRERIQKVLKKKKDWNMLNVHFNQIKSVLKAGLEVYRKASSDYDEIYIRFVEAQAGWMAKNLQDGEPCPVCGSTHHPRLCELILTDELVDQAMVDQAKKLRDDAQKDVDVKTRNQMELSNSVAALQSQILQEASEFMKETFKVNGGETLDSSEFWGNLEDVAQTCETYCDQLRQQLEELTSNLKIYEANITTIKDIEEKRLEIKEKSQILMQKMAVWETEKKQCEENVFKISEKLVYVSEKEAQNTIVNLEEKMGKLKETKETMEKTCEQDKNTLRQKQGQLKERQTQLKQVKNEAENSQKAYRKLVEHHSEFQEMTKNQLEDVRKSYQQQEKQIYSIHQTNQKVMQHLKEMLSGYEDEQKQFAEIRNLSRVANGELAGTAKIDFQTYMQRHYFQQMITAANRRLIKMSRNQFLLECRQMDQLGKQGEVGLDLDVYSLIHDQTRDIKTLSGGESFMAALALALGMADVIQQEAGKIHVDTLFIDEGFGSLDDDARNQAVKILNELAGGERLVGIISHVHELKEQIEQKIQVVKTEHGSKISPCYFN